MYRGAAITLLVAITACGGGGPVPEASSAVAVSGIVCGSPMRAGAVVIDEGLVLTVAHAVAGAVDDVDVVTSDGIASQASVVGFDPARDLALLAAPGLRVAPAATSSGTAGDTGFIVIVAPDATSTRVAFTVVRRITATGDDIYRNEGVERRALELSADVAPGASGAPAVDGDGRVVGIVFAESRTRGVTYAIDIAEAEAFVAETDASRSITPGSCP